MQEMEEKMCNALLTFIDILYAVVYGLILVQTFDQVISSEMKTMDDVVKKTSNLILVFGVFYFLTWDWLQGRLLTLKNPYKSYRRFFIEVVITFLSYGAARGALKMEITFLAYIFLGLLLGAWWARSTLQEYPDSGDAYELRIIAIYQTAYTFVGTGIFLHWYFRIGKEIRTQESITFVVFGVIFVFMYDLLAERSAGIMGGPRVPFVTKERMDKIRAFISPYFRM